MCHSCVKELWHCGQVFLKFLVFHMFPAELQTESKAPITNIFASNNQ